MRIASLTIKKVTVFIVIRKGSFRKRFVTFLVREP